MSPPWPIVIGDSGIAVWYLLGAPLIAAALPSLGGNLLLWIAAPAVTGWSLVVGVGLYLLPAGICLLAAAAVRQGTESAG